ncbi:resistin-like [Polyodon spathula]|uniref:resistin-like n=1 Tax=Polyodon spathula TaxID=7913 RepID=UPI001B7F27AB|nr:resistin-like [Polyodon spathula]XP_041097900.1 resistin-like [Polyodon spathula]
MKMRVVVLLAVIAMFCAADAQTCALDNLMSSLTQSVASSVLQRVTLVCINVSARGSLVNCPRGYKPTCCSCGNACGSWDIRNDQTCHCQCANQDWTSARCCRIAVIFRTVNGVMNGTNVDISTDINTDIP